MPLYARSYPPREVQTSEPSVERATPVTLLSVSAKRIAINRVRS